MQKDITSQTLIKQLFTRYQIFMELPKISHAHKNLNFQKYNLKETDYKFL